MSACKSNFIYSTKNTISRDADTTGTVNEVSIGGEDFDGNPVDINIDAITYFGIDEQDKERLGEDYLFNIPTNVIYGYTLGQYGDPPHFEIKTFEENPQVKQFVNKKQKEIIERFGMMGANIHPAMYLTPEQVEEMRESQNWRKELEE